MSSKADAPPARGKTGAKGAADKTRVDMVEIGKFKKGAIALCALIALGAQIQAQAQDRKAPVPGPSKAQQASDPMTLSFVGVEIEAVARAMALMAGKAVVVDSRVKGLMTLVSDRPVTVAKAIGLFTSELRTRGFALVDTNGVYKVMPEADAKLQGLPVSLGAALARSEGGPMGGQIVTRIFKLSNESAASLVGVLRPLIGPNNTINANSANNTLVVTDYAENIAKLAKIIDSLDAPMALEVEIIQLKHAVASDAAALLGKLMDAAGGQGSPADGPRSMATAEPRSNSVVIRAPNLAKLELAKKLLAKIDMPNVSSNGAMGNIYVVNLKNADATKMAATLRAAIGSGAGSGSAVSGAAPAQAQAPLTQGGPASMPGGHGGQAGPVGPSLATFAGSGSGGSGGGIQADSATNSLVITAPEPVYLQLRAVIDRLDVRRAQVYVESLIVEVNESKSAQLGIQWQGILGNKGSNNIGVVGTNFGGGGNNLLNLTAQIAGGGASSGSVSLPGAGINLALAHNFGGVYGLAALANFLEANGDANVLSRPNLLTLDNEEAKIVIGQNVPFVTGQYTSNNSASSTGVVNPFQTYERKDVGITLRIKPQISQDGTIKLAVFQEVSSIDAAASTTGAGLVTDTRSIESTVIVDDGAVMVIGGLLQEQYSKARQKVPGLGDLPAVGAVFRNDTINRQKTNLMVFLRPVVVRDKAGMDELAGERYGSMRLRQNAAEGSRPEDMPAQQDMRKGLSIGGSQAPRGN